MDIRHYINDDTGAIIRLTDMLSIEIYRPAENKWEELQRDNSYAHEIFL